MAGGGHDPAIGREFDAANARVVTPQRGDQFGLIDIDGVTDAISAEDLLPFQEVVETMGIAFGPDDTLYAHTFTVDAGLFTIDAATGAASLLGRSGITLAHGGDLLPNPADVLSDLRGELETMDLPQGIATARGRVKSAGVPRYPCSRPLRTRRSQRLRF